MKGEGQVRGRTDQRKWGGQMKGKEDRCENDTSVNTIEHRVEVQSGWEMFLLS